MFENNYEELTNSEQIQFKDAINRLLFKCFITRKVYDRNKKIFRIDSDYLFIEKYIDLFNDYLSYADISIDVDDSNGVIKLNSFDAKNTAKFDGVTTLVIFLLRYYYEEQIILKPNSSEILIDSSKIKELLREKGFTNINKKINFASIGMSLKILNQYNIVAKVTNSFSDSFYSFYILPSIKHTISNCKMDCLVEEIDRINSSNSESF